MIFKINNDNWKIEEVEHDFLKKKYKENTGRDGNFLYGVCQYSLQTIFINKDMNAEQKIKTLKHELCHCFIWNYGLYNATEQVGEEVICDIVSASNDFINDIVNQYKQIVSINR